MKKTRRFLILLMMLAILAAPLGAAAQPDYIRLHIVADSDSLIDQSIKRGVRDAIREYTSALLAGCDDADAAWDALALHQDELLTVAKERAALYGFEEEISLELGVFPFPDRLYGDELVPAGDYRAVRIILGEGEGHNWWCVVYPSLCLPEEADADRPVEFYSSICRWVLRMWEVISR